jgi:phage/plasmid-associated DNA primase
VVRPLDHHPDALAVDGAKEDPALEGKLATEREGLLVRAVIGLRRLMARGRFALPASIIDAGRRYRQTLDTVRGFVAEECRFDRDTWPAASFSTNLRLRAA